MKHLPICYVSYRARYVHEGDGGSSTGRGCRVCFGFLASNAVCALFVVLMDAFTLEMGCDLVLSSMSR